LYIQLQPGEFNRKEIEFLESIQRYWSNPPRVIWIGTKYFWYLFTEIKDLLFGTTYLAGFLGGGKHSSRKLANNEIKEGLFWGPFFL